MKGVLRAFALAIALAAAVVVAAPAADADPQDDYPDADVVIADDGEGGVIVYYRSESSDGTVVWTAVEKDAGSDLTVADLSEIDGSLTVVMTGGTLGDLTLVQVDVDPSSVDPVDVDFTMTSGTLDSLLAVSVRASVNSSLSSSYFTTDGPIGSMSIFIAGDVGEVSTTEDIIGVDELYLEVADGATVDRLYPTGYTGWYGEATVVLSGGTVGYMSNRASVVMYMDYDLRAGSVDYLVVGADSEGGGRSSYLSSMWTFYVQRDLTLTATGLVEVGSAILGAGVLSAPTVLCNGEEPALASARSVTLDAGGTDILLATCFQYGDGGAYRFDSYTVGGSPTRGTMRTEYIQNYQRNEVYGEDGVWPGWSGGVVPAGTVLYTDADLTLGAGAELLVEEGGQVINGGLIVCLGSIVAEGTFENNGIIERRDAGSVDGSLRGSGFVATGITARPNDGQVDVMTVTEEAVVLRASSGDIYFNSASVIFGLSDSSVSIRAPGSMYIGGEYFAVALSEASEGVWVLWTTDMGADSGTTIEVTVPANAAGGYDVVVTDADGNEMEILSAENGEITFVATGSGVYTLAVQTDEESPLALNAFIAVAIVIVAGVAVFFLLRRDRGRGPASRRRPRRCRTRGGPRSCGSPCARRRLWPSRW